MRSKILKIIREVWRGSMLGAVCLLVVFASVNNAMALNVTQSSDASVLSAAIEGPGIDIIEGFHAGTGLIYPFADYAGASVAVGTFNNGKADIDIDSGIILTTGKVSYVTWPNVFEGRGTANDVSGDAELDSELLNLRQPDAKSVDASTLEFWFTTNTGELYISYVFASEEYNEFVGSQYNDMFAFFVNGENVALLPGNAGIPVTINNVNNGPAGDGIDSSNADLFIDNHRPDPVTWPPITIEYDGLTVRLTACITGLDPNKVHKLKLAIADVYQGNDRDTGMQFDSAVFVESIAATPQHLTITTQTLPSQLVGSFFSEPLSATGSSFLDYSWSISNITLSPGLSPAVIGDLNMSTNTPDTTKGILSWTLPAVPEGFYVDVKIKVVDEPHCIDDGECCVDGVIQVQYECTEADVEMTQEEGIAIFRYTDPPVGGSSGGGAGAGGGGCFITTASIDSSLSMVSLSDGIKYSGVALLAFGFAAVPAMYRRFKK